LEEGRFVPGMKAKMELGIFFKEVEINIAKIIINPKKNLHTYI
jgi:hypothetical protein